MSNYIPPNEKKNVLSKLKDLKLHAAPYKRVCKKCEESVKVEKTIMRMEFHEKVIKGKKKCKRKRGPVGPQGPAGPRGLRGPQGPQGPAGPGCIEPPPVATQIVYVNKAGNDATADGSECDPFLTITAAMASITDATPAKRYAISIGPGGYTEPLVHLKANVQLVGASTLLTRLSIPFDINDPSWFETGFINDNRSGFVDLTLLTAPLDFNFVTASSFSGKLFFVSVNVTPTMTFTCDCHRSRQLFRTAGSS